MSEYRILNKKGGERYRYRVDDPDQAGPSSLGSGSASDAGRSISGRQYQIDHAVDEAVRGSDVSTKTRPVAHIARDTDPYRKPRKRIYGN